MKIREFFDQTNTPEQLKNFIISSTLLIPPTCCNYETKIQLYKSTKLGLIFRCNKCNKKFSIYKSECYKGVKINLQLYLIVFISLFIKLILQHSYIFNY